MFSFSNKVASLEICFDGGNDKGDDDIQSFAGSFDGSASILAPVLYNDTARRQWGRSDTIGKLRTRDTSKDSTMNGSRRRLLTSTGHPNAFISPMF